jgi:two-component system response regulator
MGEKVILLVEDNSLDEELTLRTLRRARLANPVVVARDGAEALDRLFARGAHASRAPAEAPALVLLDVNLPKISGFDVLRTIREDPATHALPVIVLLSAHARPDPVMDHEPKSPAIAKPIELAALLQAARQVGVDWLVLDRTIT